MAGRTGERAPDLGQTSVIRRLVPDDAEAFRDARQSGLREHPLSFSSSPQDDRARTLDGARAVLADSSESIVFGAFVGEQAGEARETLVGVVGLFRDRHAKAAHKMHVWGMYVLSQHRGRGFGARLLDAAIGHARSVPGVTTVRLSVSATAPDAQRLYERAGFRVWGVEPDALRFEGRSAEELHMELPLDVE